MATGRLLRHFPGSWDRRSIVLSPNGAILATVSDDTIHLWDFASGRELRRLKGHRFGTVGLAFAPDSKMLASCGFEDIRLWDAATGAEIAVLPWKRRPLSFNCLLAFTPDGKTLIAGQMFDGKIHLWDVAARRERSELTREGGMAAFSLAVSPDGSQLASGGGDGRGSGDGLIPIWDLATGKVVRRLQSEQKTIGSVAFSPDGKWLASVGGQAGSISTVCLWELSTGKVRHSWKSSSLSLTFSRDSKILIAGGSVIRRWDVAGGKEIQPTEGSATAVYTLALSPDGRKLACRSLEIDLREAGTGKRLRRLAQEGEYISDCAFAPDGKTLATVSYDGILHLWDVADGKTIRRIEAPWWDSRSPRALSAILSLRSPSPPTAKPWPPAAGKGRSASGTRRRASHCIASAGV